MRRSGPRFVRMNFIKMMLSYCLVIAVGLGLVSLFTTRWVVNTLTEKESNSDRQIVRQVRAYSDDVYVSIRNIFARLYLPLTYYNNYSIMDSINPRHQESLNRDTKRGVISSYLQDVCESNDFISDIFIVDYGEKNVYFFSNVAGRDPSLAYDFYGTRLLGGDIDNQIRLIPNHIPEYINASSVNDAPVITYGIYLFDINALRFDNPLGYCVINIRSDCFRDAFRGANALNGTLFVIAPDGTVLFDSSDSAAGKPFNGPEYGIESLEEPEPNDRYVVNVLASGLTDCRFVNIVSRDVIRREAGEMRRSLYSILVVCVLLALIISAVSAFLFTRRIKGLVRHMQALELGEFSARARVRSNDEIGYLESSFNRMADRLNKHIQTEYVYQLKSKTAQLSALQAQINPHFLFNTLESIRINALMHQDPETAKMIHIMGNLFRFNIKTPGLVVTLTEEIDNTRSFIELQKMRYDDAFDMEVDVPQNLHRLGVPKFILQPLVENAIKHGRMDVTTGGVIRIIAREEPAGRLTIAVADNGCGMDAQTVEHIQARLDSPEEEPDDHYSIGLSNVHQRIRILFGEPYGLTIESKPGVETVVGIVMPAMEKEALEEYVQGDHRG